MKSTVVVNNFENFTENDNWGWFVDLEIQTHNVYVKKKYQQKYYIEYIEKKYGEINDEYEYHMKENKNIHSSLKTINETVEYDSNDDICDNICDNISDNICHDICDNNCNNCNSCNNCNNKKKCLTFNLIKISCGSLIIGLLTYIIYVIYVMI